MSWLLRDGDVLAAVDPAPGGWPEMIHGAVVRSAPVLPHTLRCGRSLDLAWCRDSRTEGGEPCLVVRATWTAAPRRLGRPRLSGAVVAAERGAFERWRLQVGDQLELREV